jgi:6-pyruvoyltetrahydropterin/6-carboxytetrahydropterin synthase
MYHIQVEDKFSSAHQLRGYKGKCENIHGHNFKVFASVKGEQLNDIGLLMDFHDLKAALKEVLKSLDHKHLNETEMFSVNNPSSENIARYIYEELEKLLPEECDVAMDAVSVYESETSKCTYTKS